MGPSMPIGGGGGQQSVDFGGGGPSQAEGAASTGSTINFNTPQAIKQSDNQKMLMIGGAALIGLAALWIVKK